MSVVENHHLSPNIATAVQPEINLLIATLSVRDKCWEQRLRTGTVWGGTSTCVQTYLRVLYCMYIICILLHAYFCMYTHMCMHAYIQTCVHTHTHTRARAHTHTHTHMHTHTHTHTHAHTHTHTILYIVLYIFAVYMHVNTQ